MTNAPNSAFANPGAGMANSSAPISVGDINVEGNVDGNIVIGNNNKFYDVRVHNQIGAVFNLQVEPVIERHKMIPQPPRPPRGFVGRNLEQEALNSSVVGKEAIFVYGHDGLGKTSLIRQVANSEYAKNLPDGVVYLESIDERGESLGFQDIVQRLFDSFYLANPPLKVNFTNAKTHLSNTVPLVVLDGFNLPATAIDKVPDLFPHGALLVASRNLSAGEDAFQPYTLSPLLREDAIQLLAGKSGLSRDTSTSAVLDRICELCGDVPLAITKLANLIRHKGVDLSNVLRTLERTQSLSGDKIQDSIERSFAVVYSLLNIEERDALAIVAAAPGISVERSWLESVAQDQFAVAELESLELIQANSPRMRIANGLRQFIYSKSINIQAHRSALLDHLRGELKSRSLDFDFVGNELGNILGLLEWATNEKRWTDVVALGRAVDPYLTLKGFWDAWEKVLNQILLAGQNLRDQAIQAWALHQLGSREIGVGSRGQAIGQLVRALRIREAMGDKVGAAYTRHNLNIILPPKPTEPSGKTRPPYKPISRIPATWITPGLLVIAALGAAILIRVLPSPLPMLQTPTPNGYQIPDGWEEYIVQEGDTFDSVSERVAFALDDDFKARELPVLKLAIENANFNYADEIKTQVSEGDLDPIIKSGQRIYVPVIPKPIFVPVTKPPEDPSMIVMEISTTLKGAVDVREVGQTVDYFYDIAHSESRPLEGSLSVTDNRVTEITCPGIDVVGNLDGFFDPGEIITCTASYKIIQADIDYGSVSNAAKARIGEIVSNEAKHTVEIAQIPGLEISKKAEPAIYTRVGQEITYIYTVLNSGNVTLSPVNIFVRDDHIDRGEEGIICGPEGADLAPGEEVDCAATYQIAPADLETRSVTNNATASIYGHRIKIMDDQVATATINYPLPPTLKKTADPKEYDREGQIVTYTYAIKNINPMPIPGPVTVSDYFVSDENTQKELTVSCLDIISLDPDKTETCTLEYAITQADLDRGSVTNEATARVGDISSETVIVTIRGIPDSKLNLTKTAVPTTYNSVGQSVTYTYVITNSGNVTLGPDQFMILDDHLIGSTSFDCGPDAARLAPQETLTCNKAYSITSGDVDARIVTNTATASGGGATSPPATAQVTCPYPPAGWVAYVIQPGDTIYNTSTWYKNITATDLMQANCLFSDMIRPGQNLYVPSPPPPAKIFGIVFSDPNRNNHQDDGEKGVPNTVVALIDLSTNNIIDTETTDANGNYTFFVSEFGYYQIFQAQIRITKFGQVVYRKFGVSPAD